MKSNRHFTEAAREGAKKARLERVLVPVDARLPQVFAIRLPWPSNRFGWEIRRYGCFVLSKSEANFGSMAEAYAAGETVLARGGL